HDPVAAAHARRRRGRRGAARSQPRRALLSPAGADASGPRAGRGRARGGADRRHPCRRLWHRGADRPPWRRALCRALARGRRPRGAGGHAMTRPKAPPARSHGMWGGRLAAVALSIALHGAAAAAFLILTEDDLPAPGGAISVELIATVPGGSAGAHAAAHKPKPEPDD